MSKFSVSSYLYRDASNYKADGQLLLKGTASLADVEILRQQFESGGFFIAEQLGIPVLYAELWAFSIGPTADDHVWHTFEELRAATADDMNLPTLGTVSGLIKKVTAVSASNERLSPHWGV